MSYIVSFYDDYNKKPLSTNELEHLPETGSTINLSGIEYKAEKVSWILEKCVDSVSSIVAIDIFLAVIPDSRTLVLDKHNNVIRCDECGDILEKNKVKYVGLEFYCLKH